MLEIKKCRFMEMYTDENFQNLIDEGSASPEVVIETIPISIKVEHYKTIDKTGALTCFVAYFNGRLIGFITITFPALAHHAPKVAIEDAVYVLEAYRSTGAGLKLIIAAEEFAKAEKAVGIIFSASAESPLEQVLKTRKYKDIRHLLYKALDE